MFKHLKEQVKGSFDNMSELPLFYVNIDRDKVWEVYINGFSDPTLKQNHTCNCCKSFLRQWAGIVTIKDNKIVSIWDGIEVEGYVEPIKNLSKYIHSLPITDVFFNEFASCGTNFNFDVKNQVTWNHFHLELPKRLVIKDNIDAKRGELRTKKEVFKRGLDELTIDAVETILELIAQGSLYRGNEFKVNLESFLKYQKEYNKVPKLLKDNYAWYQSQSVPPAISGIRNTAIGTLIINLSEGMELDTAVSKYEAVVAPTNYKRPTALVTPKMVEQAKSKLEEMGLVDSLSRRYAHESDLNVNDILFTDKSTSVKDVFDEMAKDVIVNPKTLTKVEEITAEDFIEKVVPTSKSIELLVENSHLSNLVSLVTAEDKLSPSLFKWNNPFSWSYTGGITDSMKERVKAAGGKVDGVLRFSLSWNENKDNDLSDLDAWCQQPDKQGIGFNTGYRKDSGNRLSSCSGQLDLDDRGYGNSEHLENIYFADIKKMKEGTYLFWVNQFSAKGSKGFKAEIECDGEIYSYEYNKPLKTPENVKVAKVTLKNGIFTVNNELPADSRINSKEKWNIKTNQFHRVNKFMLSPNHWENKTGNKHYMFFLEGCKSDETPRPFFNEFLKPEFNENRKVFEIMGSKLRIKDDSDQLSGIGFSETQRNHAIVRVNGKFKRTLKVNF